MKKSVSITTGVIAAVTISVPTVYGTTAYANTHMRDYGHEQANIRMNLHHSSRFGSTDWNIHKNGSMSTQAGSHSSTSTTQSHQQTLAALHNEVNQLHSAIQGEKTAKANLKQALKAFVSAMKSAMLADNQNALNTGINGAKQIHNQLQSALSLQKLAKGNLQQYTKHKGTGDLSRAMSALSAAISRETAETAAMKQATTMLQQLTSQIQSELGTTSSSSSVSSGQTTVSGSGSTNASSEHANGSVSGNGSMSGSMTGSGSVANSDRKTTMQTYHSSSVSILGSHHPYLPLQKGLK
jgi:hypothetical protein